MRPRLHWLTVVIRNHMKQVSQVQYVKLPIVTGWQLRVAEGAPRATQQDCVHTGSLSTYGAQCAHQKEYSGRVGLYAGFICPTVPDLGLCESDPL
jgi:hypothetical protein